MELGCGNGKTLSALACCDAVGLDHSLNALRSCPAGPSLIRGDILHLPFRDGSFDMVLLHHVLQHLMADERHKAAAEAFRVLRPGGKLSVRTFSVQDMRFGKGDEVESNTFQRGNGILYHYFHAHELRTLLSSLEEIGLDERTTATKFAKGSVRAELVGTFRRP